MAAWRLLLDETVDPTTATYLRTEGVDTETGRDALDTGVDDEEDILPTPVNTTASS